MTHLHAEKIIPASLEVLSSHFCGTRRVDNNRVSDQLISLWENIIALSKFRESLSKKKRRSSKSYLNVKKAVDDDLTVSKLSLVTSPVWWSPI